MPTLTAEQKLVYAVVLQSLRDLVSPERGTTADSHSEIYPDRAERYFARVWLEDDRDDPYAYRWCCDHLKLDAVKLRAKIVYLLEHDPEQLRAIIEKLDVQSENQSECDPADLNLPSRSGPEQLSLFYEAA